jgi:TPR repeat protein
MLFTILKGRFAMWVILIAVVLALTNVTVATAVESSSGQSKKSGSSSIPLAGEEPYAALQRGDYRLAAGLFYPLAERGDARAQYNLGLLYASGLGVTHDYQTALKWYRQAAQQGHAGAQGELGQMYAKGDGLPQDAVRAHMWYSVAAASMSSGSQKEMIRERDRIESRMTPEQIAKAQQMAEQCQESKFKKCN